jgi:hypothetical protein
MNEARHGQGDKIKEMKRKRYIQHVILEMNVTGALYLTNCGTPRGGGLQAQGNIGIGVL